MVIAVKFCKLKYEDMIPFGKDWRLILHEPSDKRTYWGLRNEEGEIVAGLELETTGKRIHIDCLFVPEEFRGNRYAYDLIMNILFENQDKYASAEANDWSIKTFLRAGFKITATRKCKYWMKYFVRKEPYGKTKD